MHVARMFLDRMMGVLGKRIEEMQRTAVLAAALLHDIGHGPFSHALEKTITGERHEKRTREIIRDEATEVNRCLRGFDRTLPDLLDSFFSEDIDESSVGESPIPAYLTQIVSSQLDADRFDYLLRDSYATGTDYGRFDLKWLLQNLFLDETHSRFYLGHKAILAAEQYVYARYHMYRMVYFHKTTRAAEVMLRLLLDRFKDRMRSAENDNAKQRLAPGAPPSVIRAFSGPMSLEDYLQLDDYSFAEFWRGCERSGDEILRELGGGLLHRRLYKAIDVTGRTQAKVGDFATEAHAFTVDHGLDPEYALPYDTPGDTPYKPYDPDAETPATQIHVETGTGERQELSRHSDMVHGLTKRYTLVRYYCPERIRTQVEAIAAAKLGKE
jgi:HD superfamily phosphohydrolase